MIYLGNIIDRRSYGVYTLVCDRVPKSLPELLPATNVEVQKEV